MLTQRSKLILSRPILGLPPGMALGGAALCLAGGLFAAMTLDKLSRAQRGDAALSSADVLPTEVFEQPDTGVIRTATTEDALAWIRHSAPFPASDPSPRLAIIVVDDGSDIGAARSALKLSAPVSLAIAATADSADKTAIAARSADREVLLLLPMQSESHFDITPNPIAINVPRPELQRRMNWNLAQFDGYLGVMNQFGEDTSRDPQTMRAVLEVVQQGGLAYIDALTHPDSLGGAVARRMGVPTGDRTYAVKPGTAPDELRAQLDEAARHAERWGTAIISVPADRRLIAALGEWRPADNSGVKITPVSAVIKRLRTGKR